MRDQIVSPIPASRLHDDAHVAPGNLKPDTEQTITRGSGAEVSYHPELKSVEKIEKILDRSIRLPGGLTVGLDGIIGLIPGVGDLATTGIGSFLLYKAYKLNVPKIIIARMGINMAIDTVLGSIPLLGDLFDFAWKSNTMNAKLIQQYWQKPEATRNKSLTALLIVGILALLAIGFAVWLAFKLVAGLLGLIF